MVNTVPVAVSHPAHSRQATLEDEDDVAMRMITMVW